MVTYTKHSFPGNWTIHVLLKYILEIPWKWKHKLPAIIKGRASADSLMYSMLALDWQ